MLHFDNLSLSWGSPLPLSLRTLSITAHDQLSAARAMPQLCDALRALPALEHFTLWLQKLQPHLAPLLAALQYSPLLTHLDMSHCCLNLLPEG